LRLLELRACELFSKALGFIVPELEINLN